MTIEPTYSIVECDPALPFTWLAVQGLDILLAAAGEPAARYYTGKRLTSECIPPPAAIWVLRHLQNGMVAGIAILERPTSEHANSACCTVVVSPIHRRLGMGTRLLRPLADRATALRYDALIGHTVSLLPAGVAFLIYSGALPDQARGACPATGANASDQRDGQLILLPWRLPLDRLRDHLRRVAVPL